MASSRTTAIRSLNRLAKSSGQTRHLHITGPSQRPVLAADSEKWLFGFPAAKTAPPNKWAFGFPQEKAGKRMAEKEEYVRTFSTSDSNYDSPYALHALPSATPDHLTIAPKPTSTPFSPTSQKTRHFNTSRELKRVGDTSTIDFAYLPTFPIPSLDETIDDIRVPLLPSAGAPPRPAQMAPFVSEVMAEHTPSISTAAADGTHLSTPSAMADAHDNGGHMLDIHEVAEQLTSAAKKITLGTDREAGEEVKRAKGLAKQVWTGLLEDGFGQRTQKA